MGLGDVTAPISGGSGTTIWRSSGRRRVRLCLAGIVQGVGFIKRHTRPNPQRNIKGGIAEREAPIHVSNVMIVSGDDDKRTRIGSKTLSDGRKVRIARRGGEVLDK